MGTIKDDKKILLRYLKNKGLYNKYWKYAHSPKTWNPYQKQRTNWTFDGAIKECGLGGMITSLINWIKTDEGATFWYNIHCDFNNFLKDIGHENIWR